jgi:hypothetical protein
VPYEKVKKLLQAAPQELVLWMLEVQPAANEVCSEPPSNQSPKAPSREKVLDQSELPSQDSELDSQDDSSDNSESSNKSDKSNHPPNDDAMEGNESPNDGNEDGNQSPNDGSCENNVKETEAAENEVFIFVRKQVRDVLSESKKKMLSFSLTIEECFKLSEDHPMLHMSKAFKDTMKVSIVHVREQLQDDGLLEYSLLVRNSEKLLTDIFKDKTKIKGLMCSKFTTLLAVTAKCDKSNDPFLVLSVILLHPLTGVGFISYAATHQGRFRKALHSEGDDLPYSRRGFLKALMLLGSEVCVAFCGTRCLYLQTRSDEDGNLALFTGAGFQVTDDPKDPLIKVIKKYRVAGFEWKKYDGLLSNDPCMITMGIRDKLNWARQPAEYNGVSGNELDSGDDDSHRVVVNSGNATSITPRVLRQSPRIIAMRLTTMESKHPRRGTNKETEFQKLMVNKNQQWHGVYSNGKKVTVGVAFVQRNFCNSLIKDCIESPNTPMNIYIGAPKNTTCPVEFQCTTIPVYQQLHRMTCVLSSAASAFRYFNDQMAHNILRNNILRSEGITNRLGFVESLLVNTKLKYTLKKFGYGQLNIFKDISCYPTLINLEGEDGSCNHAVTVVRTYLFDANAPYAQNLSFGVLDWCCSTDDVSTKFRAVKCAIRFSQNKSRKEWNVCDSCRSHNPPCLYNQGNIPSA